MPIPAPNSISVDYDARQRIVTIRFVGTPTTEDYVRYLAKSKQLMLTSQQKRGVLLDCLLAKEPGDARHRKLTSEWIAENRELIALQTVGQAFVMRSAAERAIVSAVLFVQPLPCPHKVLDNLEDAYAWLDGLLARS